MYMSVHNWFGLINMLRSFFKQSTCFWCVTNGKAFNYFFSPRFPSASLCKWCCNMRFKGTGTFAQNMEASSSIFSPESWTLLPGRKWLQDPTLKHQTFRSLSVHIQCVCPAQRDACIRNSFCGSFPGQATAQMLLTLSQLPACDGDSRIKPQKPPSSTVGWDL